MLALILTALIMLAATVLVHGLGTMALIRHLKHRYADPDGLFKAHAALPAVTLAVIVLTTLHFLEILL